MTAFARVASEKNWGSLVWEIRSVNHRYLEASIRLPESLRQLESSLKKSLNQSVKRGKIDCYLRLNLNPGEAPKSQINQEQMQRLKNLCQQIQQTFPDSPMPDRLSLLNWPGLLIDPQVNLAPLSQDICQSFEQALLQLQSMRQTEGAELKKFIQQRLEQIPSKLQGVKNILPKALDGYRQRLIEQMQQSNIDQDPHRLEQEMILLAQKLDLAEEIDRLQTHSEEVARILDGQAAMGRRLDFLMQELNREANTLSSKSIHSQITTHAVDLKVLIEQMREQIQNIE